MGNANNVLERLVKLESLGANSDMLIDILEEYNNPYLKKLGYRVLVDEMIADVANKELKGERIDYYIDAITSEWYLDNGTTDLFEIGIDKVRDLGKLEKKAILYGAGIPNDEVNEMFEEYENNNLHALGYSEMVDEVVRAISSGQLTGKAAIEYARNEISKWGEEETGLDIRFPNII
jgi:hypothetical protein